MSDISNNEWFWRDESEQLRDQNICWVGSDLALGNELETIQVVEIIAARRSSVKSNENNNRLVVFGTFTSKHSTHQGQIFSDFVEKMIKGKEIVEQVKREMLDYESRKAKNGDEEGRNKNDGDKVDITAKMSALEFND